jgi:hypothetical protein
MRIRDAVRPGAMSVNSGDPESGPGLLEAQVRTYSGFSAEVGEVIEV